MKNKTLNTGANLNAYILRPLPIYALPYSFTDICPNSALCQNHLTWYATFCGGEGISSR